MTILAFLLKDKDDISFDYEAEEDDTHRNSTPSLFA